MSELFDIMNKDRQVAILVDPDKTNDQESIERLISKLEILNPAFIFIGGSTVNDDDFDRCILEFKKRTKIPVIIFPGSHNQIHDQADGILFLSLISGRNPDYLIGHQIASAHKLKSMDIEVVPTGYLLIEGGKNSSVSYVSQTSPIPRDQKSIARKTAIAGEMMGMKAIFMDAGSGALNPVPVEMIKEVSEGIDCPLIIGGGLRSIENIENAFNHGANIVVIGNKIEEDIDFLLDIKTLQKNTRD